MNTFNWFYPIIARLLLFLLLCGTLAVGTATAQVSVTVVPDAAGVQADYTTRFPTVSAVIRVVSQGAVITPSASNVWIIENNRPLRPTSVVGLPDGNAQVEWTSLRTASGFATQIVVIDRGATGTAVVSVNKSTFARVVWVDADNRGSLINMSYDFGQRPVGSSDTAKFRLAVQTGEIVDGKEEVVRIDSIRVRSTHFKIQWVGSIVDRRPAPPSTYTPGLDYRVNIIAEPRSAEPIVDTLTVYFQGGVRQSIVLFANRTTYSRLPKLFMLSPNGGEAFAPCQEIPIRWTGSLRRFKSFLDYSLDGGRSWQFIDSTLDTTYMWRVPANLSEDVLIRVSQRYQSTLPRSVQGLRMGASAVAFNSDGSRIAIAYLTGSILEFDAETLAETARYTLSGSGFATSISYVGATQSIVAAILRQGGSRDALQRFDAGSTNPAASIDLAPGYRVSGMGLDRDGTNTYVWAALSGSALSFSTATLAAGSALPLSQPLAAAAVDGADLVVALIDGTVLRYSLPDLTERSRFVANLPSHDGPLITRVGIAPSRRFVVLAGEADAPKQIPQNQATYILDLANGRLVDIFTQSTDQSVTGIGFTGSENNIIFGTTDGTAMRAYDLENLRLYTLPGSGHLQSVTGLAIAPDGSTYVSVSTDRDETRNAIMRSLATPEEDVSDRSFAIRRPRASTNTVQLPARLVGLQLDTLVDATVCNSGSVPWIVNTGRFLKGDWISLRRSIDGDTVLPGACLRLQLRVVLPDTGALADTLVVESCGATTAIAFSIRGIDRSLTLLTDGTDFGDVCVGNRQRRSVRAIRNNDNVPVVVNRLIVVNALVERFRVATVVADTVIPPGGTLDVDIEFFPNRLGPDTATIVVGYAGSRAERFVQITGRGTGVDIQTSHSVLPFIGGIQSRRVVLRNATSFPANVVSAELTAGAPFRVEPDLPRTIPPGDSLEVVVTYEGGAIPDDAMLTVKYSPCGVNTEVRLVRYRGQTTVALPFVTADPRGDAVIPVSIEVQEDEPYKGVRPFAFTFLVNPRLFLAREVSSDMGNARIISQDIVDGLRHVAVSVEGDFKNGTIIGVRGWAGLAEADWSALIPDTSSAAFGAEVATSYTAGELRIESVDNNRRIVPRFDVQIVGVFPNPVTAGTAQIELLSRLATTATVRVYNPRGLLATPEFAIDLVPGNSLHSVDLSGVQPGVYTIVVQANGLATSLAVVVL